MTNAQPAALSILQWNCRSFASKRHQLAFFVLQDPPDVIAIEESNAAVPYLQQYAAFTDDPQHHTATFVHNTHLDQSHRLP